MSHQAPLPRLTCALALLALGGCASANAFHPPPAAAHADAKVTVQNPQWLDLTVYLERDGSQMRLGVVPGNASKVLTIPDYYVSRNASLRLVALSSCREPRGASNYFQMDPGTRASWTVGITGLTTPVGLAPPP